VDGLAGPVSKRVRLSLHFRDITVYFSMPSTKRGVKFVLYCILVLPNDKICDCRPFTAFVASRIPMVACEEKRSCSS
jgi:hypothetical protein